MVLKLRLRSFKTNFREINLSNRFLGVIVGALVMVIQSSSATTVMVVGFVNAQMMTLQQAVWIIMELTLVQLWVS